MIQDTSSNLRVNNPVIPAQTIAAEQDTGIFKIGDGVTRYNALSVAGRDNIELSQIARNIRSYGAVPNDESKATINRLALQQAIDDIPLTGGSVYIPEGVFYVNKSTGEYHDCVTINNRDNIKIIGAGIGATKLKVADATAVDSPVMVFRNCSFIEVSHFEIDGTRGRIPVEDTVSEDEGLNFKDSTNVSVHDMYIHDCGQDAIDCDDCADVSVHDCVLEDCDGNGIHLAGPGQTGDRILICNVRISNTSTKRGGGGLDLAAGISMAASNVKAIGCYINSCFNGIWAKGTRNAGGVNTKREIIGCTISDSTRDNVLLDGGGYDKVVSCNINGAGSGYSNISANSPGSLIADNICENSTSSNVTVGQSDIVVTGNRVYAGTTGIRATASNCIISNNRISHQSFHGIVISGSSVTGTQVLGNRITNTTQKAVDIQSNSTGAIVKNNDFTGVTNPVGITGTGHVIRNNAGYVTENSGTAVISSGATTVAVTHGLGKTPALSDIFVVPSNGMGNAVKFYLSNPTSTTFTINVNADPGSETATFVWQAQCI